MSHKAAKEIRKFLRSASNVLPQATNVAYTVVTHVKLSKDGTRYERYQIKLTPECGRAMYKRMKKKHKR